MREDDELKLEYVKWLERWGRELLVYSVVFFSASALLLVIRLYLGSLLASLLSVYLWVWGWRVLMRAEDAWSELLGEEEVGRVRRVLRLLLAGVLAPVSLLVVSLLGLFGLF